VGIGIFPNLMNFQFYPDQTASTYLSPNTAVSGDAHASFLLGLIDQRSTARGFPFQTQRSPFIGTFIHDDWKISRNVTLNLGLRHEWESAPYDDNDIYSRFLDLSAPNQAMQQNPAVIPGDLVALSRPTFNGAWVFTDSENRKPFVTQKNIFLPRIGVAVRVNDKTAVNVGFARYAVPVIVGQGNTSANTLAACQWCPGFNQTSNPLPFVEGRPQAYLADPFPASNPLQLPIGKSLGANTNVGNTANWANQDYKQQINDRINFTIMREIPGQFKVDATWFMNIGRNVPHSRNINMADPNFGYTYKAQLSQNITNPFLNYLTQNEFPGDLRRPGTVTRGSLLRPYPHYGDLTVNNVSDWRARYQALQLRVQRSYAAGASVLFAYNYNQEREEWYFDNLAEYADREFWRPSNNARHRATIAGTYELPVGKGKQLGADMHPVLNGIFGGWIASGIYTYRSGEFLRFQNQMDFAGDPYIDNPGPGKWFNTDAFKVPTPFTPRTNPWQFDGITGPIMWNLDGTVSKTFPIAERYKLEFRLEAYNLTNSLMWANPNMTVGNALFGRSTTQAQGNRGREIQYTLRLQF
jgi:hypothetical protein